MKPPVKLIAPVLLLLLAAGGGWYYWQRNHGNDDGRLLTLHGNVDIRQVELAFNASDRIARMLADEGDRVEAGQLLAELETDRLRRRVEQAAARVEVQEAVLARLRAGARPQEIRQLRAEVEAAEYRAEDAGRTARRLADLAERELVSHEEADAARSRAQTAQAELRAAREALELALAGTRAEDIAAAAARLRADRASLALAEQELADASLHAPAAGVIEQRLLQPGDMASPQRPAYTLALTEPLWVRAWVGGGDLGHIRPGMTAAVHTDSFPDKAYAGWIGHIAPTAEFTPKSVQTREVRTDLVYQVRVLVCDPAGELRLGMPATVTVPLDQQAPQATDRGCGGD